MIIQFSVENFRSIMEPAILSLVASPLKDTRVVAEDVIFDIDGIDVSLLKSAVILGANASGKSNVIKALDFFKSCQCFRQEQCYKGPRFLQELYN